MREKEAVPFACGNMLYSMGKKLFFWVFYGIIGFLDWGEFFVWGKFNGERNCGGWGKLWLGFLDEIWGIIMYNLNQKLLK